MRKLIYASILALITAALTSDSAPAQSTVPSCPEVAPQSTLEGTNLDAVAGTRNGTVFDTSGAGSFRLANVGGLFEPVPSGADVSKDFDTAAVADFNGDGLADFVTGQDATGATQVHVNASSPLPAPPTFNSSTVIPPASQPRMVLGSGDFDGDGLVDVLRINVSSVGGAPQSLHFIRNTGNVGVDPQFAAPAAAHTSGSDLTALNSMLMPQRGSNLIVVDYNDDRLLDFIVASSRTTGGAVHKFRNNCTPDLASPPALPLPLVCTDQPTFSYDGDMIQNLGLDGGNPIIAYDDFNGDNVKDLLVAGTTCCSDVNKRMRMWFGQSSSPGTLDTSSNDTIALPFIDARYLIAGDFSLDGKLDVMVGLASGRTLYYENDDDASPFFDVSDPGKFPTDDSITVPGVPMTTFKFAMAFDYDGDAVVDFLLSDGTGPAKLFANRAANTFVLSGDVESGLLDLGALANVEMVITGARLRPTQSSNDGTINIDWYMANGTTLGGLPNYELLSSPCPAPDTDWLCVVFPDQFDRQLRWRAAMTTTDNTRTPNFSKVEVRFDYTRSAEHYRAGVVVQDGVAYIGAFRQPGQRGKFYAVSADLQQFYWEAGEILDREDQPRNLYTADSTGRPPDLVPASRLDFAYSGPVLTTPNDFALSFDVGIFPTTLNGWALQKRFGVLSTAPTHLGAIETSTPAVVGPPGLTPWYVFADNTERGVIDAFVANNANRVPLVLVGGKSGMLHAFRNDATQISDPRNGYEAWAFAPHEVASNMNNDKNNSIGPSIPPGTLVINNFSDGSPTVADVRFIPGGPIRTAAVYSLGRGGKSFVVLDITQTVNPVTDLVTGPLVKWSATPGGANAGFAKSKPAIIRVDIDPGPTESERFLVVAATGPDDAFEPVGPYTRGRDVIAYNIGDGTIAWQVKTACPVTTNITAFETDDAAETGPPALDGYIDRLVFGDKCGFIYKIDASTGADEGNINIDDYDDPAIFDKTGVLSPLFYTAHTAGNRSLDDAAMNLGPNNPGTGPTDPATDIPPGYVALKGRPIVGTIAARTDSSGDMMLFFGTGGLESLSKEYHNEFLIVKATDGVIRSRFIGTCNPATSPAPPGNPRTCEKFYGGVTTTANEFIFAGTYDPPPANPPACEQGETFIRTANLDAGADGDLSDEIDATVNPKSAAISKSIYARGGAIYLSTVSGEILRIGTSNAPVAGAETASGVRRRMGQGQGGGLGIERAVSLLAWRQIF